jgi:hypothetical protein
MTKAYNLFGTNTPPDERMRRSDAILAEEHRRRAANAAKTARLRELRLAREAAEEAPAPRPKRRK